MIQKKYLYRNKDWLKKKYQEEGLRISEIAEITGVHCGTIQRWMRWFGIACRVTGWHKGPPRKTAEDYHRLAGKRGFEWIGQLPRRTTFKTKWRCGLGHEWVGSYSNISSHNCGCLYCKTMINGRFVSKPQQILCEMIGGILNYPEGSRRIDIALLDENIAIEYDCWFWHGDQLEKDEARDRELLMAGWKILHIRANTMLPSTHELTIALSHLRDGNKRHFLTLPDWGKGPIYSQVF